MSVVRQQRHERLRLGGVAGTVELSTRMPTGDPVIIRRKPGVVVFEDIPIGATVHARVDRPLSLVEEPNPGTPIGTSGPNLLHTDGGGGLVHNLATTPITAGLPIFPGSVILYIDIGAGPTAQFDDGAGNFPITAELPAGGTVNYATGALTGTTAALLASSSVTEVHGITVLGNAVYRFELAPLPPAFTAGGVSFRSRARVLPVIGGTNIQPEQHVPAYAAFAPAEGGSLVVSGRNVHQFSMPGPSTADIDRNLLRLRWVGTVPSFPPSSNILFTAVGGETVIDSGQLITGSGILWPNGHKDLVPGTIVVSLTGGAGTLRDDGKGRIVGAGGDGVVDYVSGAFLINLNAAAAAGNITVAYEHDCNYAPLDAYAEWDSLLQ